MSAVSIFSPDVRFEASIAVASTALKARTSRTPDRSLVETSATPSDSTSRIRGAGSGG
jgi:hypothetical protein